MVINANSRNSYDWSEPMRMQNQISELLVKIETAGQILWPRDFLKGVDTVLTGWCHIHGKGRLQTQLRRNVVA